ncbi:MAG: NfeD family protein [Ruminiclostridium sp.]
MEWFTDWWSALAVSEQVLYCIAIPATLVLIIQTIMLCVGFGNSGEGVNFSDTSGMDGFDGDMSGDMSGGSADLSGDTVADAGYTDGSNPGDFGVMQLFTVQGVIAFLCVFSWTGLICLKAGLHIVFAIIVGFFLGFGAMFGVAKIIHLSTKLAQNGNINIKNLLGQSGTVYIPIPPKNQGTGKVNVSAGERFLEYDAISDSEEILPSNSPVRVVDIRGGILVVEKAE